MSKKSKSNPYIESGSKNIYLSKIETSDAFDVVKEIIEAESDPDVSSINIYINSGGGSISDMFCIYDAIRLCGKKVNTFCIGRAYSAAALILSCGKNRYMTKNSLIMIHQASYTSGISGNCSSLQFSVNHLKDLQDMMLKLMSTHCNLSFDELSKMVGTDNDVYITPGEALKFGLIDKIV